MADKAKGKQRKVTVSCQFCLTLNRVDIGRVNHSPKCGSCGKPILLDRPVRVTDDDFQQVIKGAEVPVMVDFYADWCAPCKVMAPVLDEFAHAHIGEVLVAKLNTDMNPRVAQQYGIRGIPTMIVFKNGEEAARRTGAVPREDLEKLLASA
ncbi:MAG: thioredoxin [Gemmatimonadota bacterium]|nr:MAG: thioredoxin [Gemmatimonadota bacterium]